MEVVACGVVVEAFQAAGIDGVAQRDIPLVQACAMLFCAGYLILVTAADLCGIVANPRLRQRT